MLKAQGMSKTRCLNFKQFYCYEENCGMQRIETTRQLATKSKCLVCLRLNQTLIFHLIISISKAITFLLSSFSLQIKMSLHLYSPQVSSQKNSLTVTYTSLSITSLIVTIVLLLTSAPTYIHQHLNTTAKTVF